MTINKKELLQVIHVLSECIDRNFGDNIIIDDKEFYWDVPLDQVFNYSQEPKELDMGQLLCDIEDLTRLLDEESIAVSYDLVKMSSILKLLKIKSSGIW